MQHKRNLFEELKQGIKDSYKAGHLLNQKLGGPGETSSNLVPITTQDNHFHETDIEKDAKRLVNEEGKWVYYNVSVTQDNIDTTSLKENKITDPNTGKERNIKTIINALDGKYPQVLEAQLGPITIDGNGKVVPDHNHLKEIKIIMKDPLKIRKAPKADSAEIQNIKNIVLNNLTYKSTNIDYDDIVFTTSEKVNAKLNFYKTTAPIILRNIDEANGRNQAFKIVGEFWNKVGEEIDYENILERDEKNIDRDLNFCKIDFKKVDDEMNKQDEQEMAKDKKARKYLTTNYIDRLRWIKRILTGKKGIKDTFGLIINDKIKYYNSDLKNRLTQLNNNNNEVMDFFEKYLEDYIKTCGLVARQKFEEKEITPIKTKIEGHLDTILLMRNNQKNDLEEKIGKLKSKLNNLKNQNSMLEKNIMN